MLPAPKNGNIYFLTNRSKNDKRLLQQATVFLSLFCILFSGFPLDHVTIQWVNHLSDLLLILLLGMKFLRKILKLHPVALLGLYDLLIRIPKTDNIIYNRG